MKKLSLQWRITLMTALLICSTCMAMNWLIGCSGRHYMDSIGTNLSTAIDPSEGAVEYFDPSREGLDPNLTIVIYGAQNSFTATNWYITAAVTLLGGILAYFVSGRALRPLRTFVAQVEKVQPNNLADMKITEEVLPEFRQFSDSFNQMLERLDEGFTAQRQFTGNAAHELRTPLALMQTRLELFAAEHRQMSEETAKLLHFQQEQVERLSALVRTLLEMSDLRSVPRTDRIDLAPMVEEVLVDLTPLAQKNGITLTQTGENVQFIGSDVLLYRLLFNLTENAIKYNRTGGSVEVSVEQEGGQAAIRVRDTGPGIAEEYRDSIFQPFFRVDKSRSRAMGGVGLGLALVQEIVRLHGGTVRVEQSADTGTTILVTLPVGKAA